MFIFFTMTIEDIKNKTSLIEELLEKIALGSVSAIGELYELIKTDVFSYALSKMGNKQDAEDITHDTFLQIYKHAKQYTKKGKPMAWIITIELNLIRRQYQLSSRYTALNETHENISSDENVEENAINNAFLLQMLKTLNSDEREIISLHIISGLKHREIAKLFEKPLSTILSKYNRAIKKLQSAVKGKNK